VIAITPDQRLTAAAKRRLSTTTNKDPLVVEGTASSIVTRSQSMRLSMRPRINLNKIQNLNANTTPIIELDTIDDEITNIDTEQNQTFSIGRRATKRIKK
jgi:hypothetical protein